MTHKFILISFCNNPTFSSAPILCAKIPSAEGEAITFVPVSLGLPYPITHATGLTKAENQILVSVISSAGKQYISALQESDLTPLYYQELPEIVDCHSILAIQDHLYVVSTGTDEVLCYKISNNAVHNPRVIWRASDAHTDTHHINSIVEKDGELFISAFGPKSDQLKSTATNGYIHNITKDIRVKEGIYHPHSLAIRNGTIYYCNSKNKTFCSLEDEHPLFQLNGYTRGVAWLSDDLVCLASSIGRKVSKSTGLAANLADPDEPVEECSLMVGKISSKEMITKIDLSWFGPEIYDLLILKGHMDLLAVTISAQLSERSLVNALDTQVRMLTAEVHKLGTQAQMLSAEIHGLSAQVQMLNTQVFEKEQQLNQILTSKAWRFAMFLRRMRVQVLPPGSARESLAKWIKQLIA